MLVAPSNQPLFSCTIDIEALIAVTPTTRSFRIEHRYARIYVLEKKRMIPIVIPAHNKADEIGVLLEAFSAFAHWISSSHLTEKK
jgi:hypothetical protein